jgi:predicted RNase H-like HicB family nuclease
MEYAIMNEQHLHYSMYIEWSEEDQAFLVTLPEWADRVFMPATHGSTYSEAVQHGQEVLQMLVNSAKKNREPLPSPKICVA